MKVTLLPSERISRCFFMIKNTLFEILMKSFKQAYKDDFKKKLYETFEKFEIKKKTKELFSTLYEEKLEDIPKKMNTFTMLNLILMPEIFSVIQRSFKSESQLEDNFELKETIFEELISICKCWSNEEIDNSNPIQCKHLLFLISIFFYDFGFMKEFNEVLISNTDYLFCTDDFESVFEGSSTSRVSDSIVESYFGEDDIEEEEEISICIDDKLNDELDDKNVIMSQN